MWGGVRMGLSMYHPSADHAAGYKADLLERSAFLIASHSFSCYYPRMNDKTNKILVNVMGGPMSSVRHTGGRIAVPPSFRPATSNPIKPAPVAGTPKPRKWKSSGIPIPKP